MSPDELEAILLAARPQPPPALRRRVLAAMARTESSSPWWAMSRAWAAAAAALLLGNYLLMSEYRAPASPSAPRSAMTRTMPEDDAELPPIRIARILRSWPPADAPHE